MKALLLHRRFALWLLAGGALSALLAGASLLAGTTDVATSVDWLRHPTTATNTVLWDIRLPRSLGAWCAGALLALAGAVAQGLFRNPLADPYLLGSASGAALGVSLCLVAAELPLAGLAWAGQLSVTGAAFIGACAALALTLALARGVLQTPHLLLAGVIVGFVLTAITSLLLLGSPAAWRAMQSFLLGSTGYIGWPAAGLLAAVFLLCALPALLLARGLDALTLGEDSARSLGLPVPALRLALLGLLSLATATAVAQVGVVGFVGLVAPHLVRPALQLGHRQLLLAAALAGGVLLQAADVLARWLIRPAELPVGAVMACLGGIYLAVLLWRRIGEG